MRHLSNSFTIFIKSLLPRSAQRMRLAFLSTFAILASAISLYYLAAPPKARGLSSDVVISQVYGGAGCGTAGCSTYKNDYIELFNRGNSAVSLNGWSVQYASATGTTWTPTNLTNVMLQPGQYYLVQEGAGANGVNNIPTPDASGTIAMSATAGKVALVTTTTALSGACPSGATIKDLIGYGATASCFEMAVAPAPSTTTADVRGTNGCTESDNNSTDFTATTPNPRNTGSTTNPCTPLTPALSINDVSMNEGNAGTTTFTFTVSLSSAAGAGGVSFDIATQDNTATTADNDYVQKSLTSQTIAQGNTTYTFDVTVNGDTTFEPNETFFVNVTNVVGATVSDAQGQGVIVNDDVSPLPLLSINDVSMAEGNAGTTTFSFTVSLSQAAGAGGVTFDIATADGSATVANNDYVAASQIGKTIATGLMSTTFDVTVNGDTSFEPNETFFVNITNVTGANISDAQGLGTIVNDDFTRIHDIQGSGTTSPLVSTIVTTQGVVTGLRSNGFFIQEPDASVDADSNTSEGIFVFTSTAPPAAAALGNLVQVTATVQEFIPSADTLSPPITELASSPTVSLLSTGNPLPTPITLTSADTGTGGVNVGSIENLEKYEGMRVRVASLTVVAPTGGTVTETSATSSSNGTFYGVITGVARPFREPGIQANDPAPAGSGVTIPPVPRFDFNPERIRVNSFGLTGSTAIDVTAGATLTNLVGPLDYSFRTYTILPDPASPPPTVTGNVTFTAVPTPLSNEFTVSSFNLERFFDTVADGNGAPTLTTTAFNNRLNKASLAIRNVLKFPDILGVEEMENITTLQSLATKINNDAVAAAQPNPNYVPYLVEGNDVGGIDVGFLVKTAIVTGATPRVTVNAVVQEGKDTTYINPNNGQPELLNDRPPLRLMAVVNHADGRTFPITVIVVHQRSLSSIDDAVDGNRVRTKRRAQAEFLANLIQARQVANANERIVCVGDYNGFQFNDGYVDIIGTVKGTPTPANQVVLASADLVNPDLTDLLDFAAAGQNYSYSFDGDAQTIDHELANAALMTFFGHINYGRNNADFPEIYRNDSTRPERISDHDPAVAYFIFPPASCPTINVTPSNIPAGVAGSAYGPVQFMQTGGNGAITWSVSSNNLPAGLTLNSMTGVLDGTPTVAAGVNITVRATDSNTCFGEVTATLQISCPTITVSPSSGSPTALPGGTIGQSYSQTFTAAPAGGGYSYSIPLAAIPPGLTFNTATGVLSGMPTTQGTFFFTVTATGFGTCTGSQNYSLTIIPGCPTSFTVNDLGDDPDQTPGDQVCTAASGACTLRAAIMEANALGCTPLTINFSVTGTINLTSALPNLAHPNLTINGPTGASGITVRRNTGGDYSVFIINGGRTVTINNLTITNGNNTNGGGILNTGNLTLNNSTLTGNTASSSGGGLFDAGGTTLIVNSTFSGNMAQDGAGLVAVNTASSPTTTIRFSTITNNTATGLGGGLETSSGHPVTISNTIIAGNSASGGADVINFDTLTSQGNNLLGNGSDATITNQMPSDLVGTSGSPINPLLAPLGSYGGPTQTHGLLPGSLAINAGNNTGAPATDQRGIARPQLTTADIGAFESRGFTLALVGGNNQSAFVNTAFANPLVATVTANGAGEPVNGGKVTFTPPGSGASATIASNPATIAGGTASSGTVTANGTVGGPYNVAASANGATPVINFLLTNTNPPPTILAASALTRQQGTASSNSTIATVNDPNQTAGTLIVTATTVPAGITVTNIVNTNGTITADVAAGCNAILGSNTVVLTVTDSFNATSTANLTVNVTANTAPTLVYASPQSVVAGDSLTVAVTTATDNGSITGYQIVSVVPALNAAPTVNASGTVSITNAGPSGSHVITVRATDNCNATTDAQFTLNVTCQTITVSPANPTLPTGMAGSPYNQTFTQTGGIGAVTFSTSAGTLPTGLTLSTAGVLSGTPSIFGNFSFTVRATDSNNCFGERAYTLVINPPCSSFMIVITPATLANGFVGTAYNTTLSATGGTTAYTFTISAGALPAGLTLSSGGAISGTPTTTGTFTFTVTATDANGCTGTQAYTVIISGSGLQFYPLNSPVRLLDTRTGFSGCTTATGALAANSTRTQPARTVCSTIPAGATAVIGNITVVPSGPGFLTLFPSDATQPTVANSNFKAGEVTNNFFTVGLGADGAFKIFTSATTDVIIDLTGYYAPPGTGGLYYHPLPAPVRLVETRAGQTGCYQPPQLVGTNDPNANPALDLPVQGRGPGLPGACNAIPNDAIVLVGNATTVFPNAPFGFGYLTIYPSDAGTRPTAASSNYQTNDVINGPFAVKLGADGKFKVYTFSTTDLVIDISGYYSASASDANGAGLLFNPLPKPMRLLETRPDFPGLPLTGCYRTNAPIPGAPSIRIQQAWGMCSDQPPLTIPDTARAVVGNATVLNPLGATGDYGFLTFFPGNVATAPLAATSNYQVPVAFGYNRHYYVGLSLTDGTFKILTQLTTDLIVDVSGFFAP